MAEQLKNCFNDEVQQSQLLYGRDTQRIPAKIDFKNNIMPNLLKIYLQAELHPEHFDHALFYDTDKKLFSFEFLTKFLDIIRFFIELPSNLKRLPKFKMGELKNYQSRADLLGLICPFEESETKEPLNDDFGIYTVAYPLFQMGTNVPLKKTVAAELYGDFVRNFHWAFSYLDEYYDAKKVQKALKQYKFVLAPNAPEKTPSPVGYRIARQERDKSELAFVDMDFTVGDGAEQLKQLLESKLTLLTGIIFDNCVFPNLSLGTVRPRILFRNCVFTGKVYIKERVCHTLSFEHCQILRNFDFDNIKWDYHLCIMDCLFKQRATLSMKNVHFGKDNQLWIKDTVFYNPVSFKGAVLEGETKLSNLTFYDTFDFSETVLSNRCTIEHFAYAGGSSPKMDSAKNTLAETLKKYNYRSEIVALGLEDNTSGIDRDAYQVAIDSEFLNPKYAALMLGCSENYLAKKRMQDRKKVTRDSLPFIITARKIQYPVEALRAFQRKDWAALKELRQKYPIPKE